MSALAARMAMFGGGATDNGGADSPKSPSPKGRLKRMTAAQTIEKIANNDPELTQVSMANSTVFAMKTNEYCKKICEALAKNERVTAVDLTECGITDVGAADIGSLLASDNTLTKLVLNGNAIKDSGCIAIAKGLATNTTLREIELFGQHGSGKWGEGCLSEWLEMYKTNVTLLRINWSTSSKQTVTLTKMLARNTDINRALGRGEDVLSLLPPALKDNPPSITHFELEDVTKKRGGVAATKNTAREVGGQGRVMRNGVEDVAAAPGSVAARLAAMRAGQTAGATIPTPAPAPASVSIAAPAQVCSQPAESLEPVIATFTCLIKSQIREGFAMDSDKAGILAKGTTVQALEMRLNDAGTQRVRFKDGWVSEKASNGKLVLQPVGNSAAREGNAQAAAEEAARKLKAQEESQQREREQQEKREREASAAAAAAEEEKLQQERLDREAKEAAVRAEQARQQRQEQDKASSMQEVSLPTGDNSSPEPVIATFTCLIKSQIREGFAMDSDKAGILAKGTTVQALEMRLNDAGTQRVRFKDGWVSEKASNGKLVLQPVGNSATSISAHEPVIPVAGAPDPDVEALKEKALGLFSQHAFGEAISILEQAVSLSPNDSEVTEALQFAKLTQTRQKQAEVEEQSQQLQELAMAHFSAKRFAKSVEVLRQALQLQPDNSELIDALAFAELQLD